MQIFVFKANLISVIAFGILLFVTLVSGHSNGAPPSRCGTLTPGHWVSPQTMASPYTIILDKDTLKQGERISITLSTTVQGQPGFKGFLVMVKKPGVDSDSFGMFDLMTSDLSKSQPLACFGKEASAMTHKDTIEKNFVQFIWIAPQLGNEKESEDFEVRATFVQNFWTIWTNQTSPHKITVIKSHESRQLEKSVEESPSSKPLTVINSVPVTFPATQGSKGTWIQPPMVPNTFHPRDATINNPQHKINDNGDGAWAHFRKMWIGFLSYFGL